MKKFQVSTTDQTITIDITRQVQEIVSKSNITNGVCYIFIPHTTAAVTINENADPDVQSDIIMEINKIVPFNDNYRHMEGNSAAHIKASTFGASEMVIVENKMLKLGTWQSIFFCEFDGPRNRQVWVKLISE